MRWLKVIQVDKVVTIVWQVLGPTHYNNSNLELQQTCHKTGSAAAD